MYKLLLVDDNPFVLDGFRTKINLAALGIELTDVAANGMEAMSLIRKINPDILVTDIKMPKMTGMELIENIRKSNRQMKVVILSGYSDFEYARKAISLNAAEYLLKPIMKHDIENALAKIVESLRNDSGKHLDDCAKRITDAAASHNKEELALALDHFFQYIAAGMDCTSANVTETCYKLALAAREIGLSGEASPSEAALRVQLSTLKTPEEIGQWVRGLFHRVMLAAENRNKYSRTINFVISSIRQNYMKELLLKDLARELYISENYLTTLFKKETGVTFKKYLTDYRMQKAIELLCDPKYKIYEIAGLVGYDSEEHFCRTFKETMGMSPKEHRNKRGV